MLTSFETSLKSAITPSESSKPKELSTDAEIVRLQRCENQFKMYALVNVNETRAKVTIQSLEPLSAPERFLAIRDAIFPEEQFPFIDEEGQKPAQLVSRQLENKDSWYPKMEAVGRLLPKLFRLVDTCEDEIKKMTSRDQEKAIIRMVGVFHTLGIFLHPTANGNGQTFKLEMLSYLHQYIPNLRDKFIPLKLPDTISEKNANVLGIPIDDLTDFEVPGIKPKNEKDAQLIELFNEISKVTDIVDAQTSAKDRDNYTYGREKAVYDLAKRYSEQLKMPELLENFKPIDWYKPLRVAGKEILPKIIRSKVGKEKVPDRTEKTLKSNIRSQLEKRGYDQYALNTTLQGDTPKIVRTTAVLETLFDNVDSLETFILQNKKPEETLGDDKRSFAILQKTIQICEEKGEEYIKFLENTQISSKEAIMEQYNLALEYEPIAEVMDKLDWVQKEEVYKKIYASPRNLSVRERLEQLKIIASTFVSERG